MSRADRVTSASTPERNTVGWNAAAAAITILAAQVFGVALVLAVASWRSLAVRVWVLGIVIVLLLAAGFTGLVLDDLVLSRSLLVIAACVGAIWLDAVASKNGVPTLLCSSVFGAWISFAAMIPYLVANPYENGELWPMLCQTRAIETVQWMTLVAVLSFGAALLASRILLAPLERLWAGMWDRRLAFVENDGGFSLVGLALAGLAGFATKVFFGGVGFLSVRAVPASVSWIQNSLASFYFIVIYAANARMLAARRLSLAVVALDLAALAYELASGSRGKFATFIVFPLILVAVFQKRRVTWSTAASLGAVVLVAGLVVYPLLFSYRQELSASEDPGAPSASLMAKATGSWRDSYDDKLELALLRTGPSEQVLAVTSIVFFDVRHDAREFWERVAFFWVPRALWLDKPTEVSGMELGRESHRLALSNTATSVLQTGLGELFVYFGPAGALGMFVAGLMCRFADVALSCFRAPQFLRIGASVHLFREFSGVVTGSYASAMVSYASVVIFLLILLVLLALAASIFAPMSALASKARIAS